MARKRDWKPLLDAFKPEADAKPVRRSKRYGPGWKIPRDIALPSAAELLRIDALAEQAARASRINQIKFRWADATSDTSGAADTHGERQTR